MARGTDGQRDGRETAPATASLRPPGERAPLAGGTRPPPDKARGESALAETEGAGPGGRSDADELVGTSVGRYRVLSKVGAGGMGVVYRAFDPALDRTVALKVLPPLDEARRTHLEERLRREAQALARLDHHNVVAVYDVGIAAASLFVAMQFVDGATLDEHLRQHAPRPRKVLALFVAAGRGLAAAHAAGIVHRDVKPSNILVDHAGRAYVGDFGLARGAGDVERRAGASADDLLVADMTRAGAVLGTPLFMAPEQHRGEQATARSDQFSFCVSVWYELFGRHPFAGTRWELDRALVAMAADRIDEPPRRAGLPARAVRALRRGLRHDPAARWPGMTELLAELEPPSRTGWVLGGLTAAGLASGAIVASIVIGHATDRDPCANAADRLAPSVAPERMLDLANKLSAIQLPYAGVTATRVLGAIEGYAAEWSAMRVDACRANRVRRDQSDELFDRRVACLERRAAALDGALGVLATRPTAEVLDHAVELVARLPALADCADIARLAATAPPPAEVGLQARIAAVSAELERAVAGLEAGIIEGSVATAERLVADARALGWGPLVGRALRHAADAQRWDGKLELAIARLRAASVEAARGRDDPAAAEAITRVAYLLAESGKASDALVVIDDAEVMVLRAGDTPGLRSLLEGTRGDALGNADRLAEADAAYGRAIELARRQPAELHVAELLVDRADFLKRASQHERARDALLEAQRIYEPRLGPDHPKLAPLHQNLGNLYFQLKDVARGKAEHDRAIAILRRRYPPDHPNIAAAHFNIGLAAIHEGRLDDAGAAFDTAFQAMFRAQPDHPQAYTALYMLATVRLEQARYDEAQALYQRTLDWQLANLGDANLSTANTLDAIGRVYQGRDDYPAALAAMKRGLAIREKALGPDSPDVAVSLQGMAALALDGGDCAEVTALSRRALAIVDRAHSPAQAAIDSLFALASCDGKAGRIAEARAALERLLAQVDVPSGASVEQRTSVRVELAGLLDRTGERARARKLIQQAIELYTAAGRSEDAAEQQAWLAKHPA